MAVIGAGPSGLVAGKHALEAGFDVTVFEAGDALGGQWQTAAAHSGVWPGMRTNTSRAMTAFSDFPAPVDHPLHPAAEQVRAYLQAYARAFGVTGRIRFGTPVHDVRPGWTVDGERFDAVVVASGRFRRPRHAPVTTAFRGEVIHAFDYAGGVPSDWQWYTLYGALERRGLPGDEWATRLCQDYLAQVRDGSITCRPGIASIDGRRITFTDGTAETVDALICATGYDVDLPYLSDDVRRALGPDLALYRRTFHPGLDGLGVIGQFLAQGPYFPLLELQARWIVAVWSGDVALPDDAVMRQAIAQPRPPLDAHNALALTLSEALGVAPDPDDWGRLAEPLLFGPMLPPRYRLSGPGAVPGQARDRFTEQLAASPRAPVDPADLACLPRLGLHTATTV